MCIRDRFEELQYQKMVSELGIKTHKHEASETLTSMTSGMSLGVSVIVSMATMFTVCYYMAWNYNYSSVVATISGLVGMVAIMVIETVLFMIQADRANHATNKMVQDS
eukprot:TRINITY_DN5607_c0_g1_i2.p2 TRINITY_DN5607_c0_g1~~TRINITY_DN5607_c0_g1_i2.p2  ORF type:complete len:108 (-),score=52.31 TRINITY_DN5607_c0_g1_i2:202-525(-)